MKIGAELNPAEYFQDNPDMFASELHDSEDDIDWDHKEDIDMSPLVKKFSTNVTTSTPSHPPPPQTRISFEEEPSIRTPHVRPTPTSKSLMDRMANQIHTPM